MDAQDFQLETLTDAVKYFSDRDACERLVEQMRWPDGVECPYCKSKSVGHIKTRHAYQCRQCRMQFTVKVGTIFEDSPLPLSKWFVAVWVWVNCRNGISSCEVAKHIGVTQKTAWFMGQRIRLAMEAPEGGKLSGEIEVDHVAVNETTAGRLRRLPRIQTADAIHLATAIESKAEAFIISDKVLLDCRNDIRKRLGMLTPKQFF